MPAPLDNIYTSTIDGMIKPIGISSSRQYRMYENKNIKNQTYTNQQLKDNLYTKKIQLDNHNRALLWLVFVAIIYILIVVATDLVPSLKDCYTTYASSPIFALICVLINLFMYWCVPIFFVFMTIYLTLKIMKLKQILKNKSNYYYNIRKPFEGPLM